MQGTISRWRTLALPQLTAWTCRKNRWGPRLHTQGVKALTSVFRSGLRPRNSSSPGRKMSSSVVKTTSFRIPEGPKIKMSTVIMWSSPKQAGRSSVSSSSSFSSWGSFKGTHHGSNGAVLSSHLWDQPGLPGTWLHPADLGADGAPRDLHGCHAVLQHHQFFAVRAILQHLRSAAECCCYLLTFKSSDGLPSPRGRRLF